MKGRPQPKIQFEIHQHGAGDMTYRVAQPNVFGRVVYRIAGRWLWRLHADRHSIRVVFARSQKAAEARIAWIANPRAYVATPFDCGHYWPKAVRRKLFRKLSVDKSKGNVIP